MKLLILKTKGRKFVYFKKFDNGFYAGINLIPNYFGLYIEVTL